ncbi:MAG: type II toxin-antitoxin system HicA family toxin [Chroococcidiopsidaceae cyanobacterium CP_BM_RX_35]|nr:type II toxin-antitoxin system HicA family toxin [Chroococcidiopsidaceae cyanobacterium CP_BM_RX_35]
MPAFGPIKRRDLIRALRQCGFDGPFPGTNHQYMQKGKTKLPIPNPHQGDISMELLARILRQAGISREDWESL